MQATAVCECVLLLVVHPPVQQRLAQFTHTHTHTHKEYVCRANRYRLRIQCDHDYPSCPVTAPPFSGAGLCCCCSSTPTPCSVLTVVCAKERGRENEWQGKEGFGEGGERRTDGRRVRECGGIKNGVIHVCACFSSHYLDLLLLEGCICYS